MGELVGYHGDIRKSENLPVSLKTPLRIVSIGGGTGLATLLHGLKQFADPKLSRSAIPGNSKPLIDITAIVTVSDDGGSSGRLRREFDVLPPGDIRNCMVALSEDEGLLSRLFQYRFPAGRGLKGHSFGNLFLTALSNITGDFPKAVRVTSEVLAIAGQILPSTATNVVLEAVLDDGSVVTGETTISKSRKPIRRVRLVPRHCRPLQATLDAIAKADLITFGPGSLYTSVIPNLLVSGIPLAIRLSPAPKVYFMNLMWQPGETMNFKASDHVRALFEHAGHNFLDYVAVNTHPIRPALKRKYASTSAQPVENDLEQLGKFKLGVIEGDLLEQSDRIRHNPAAIAQVAVRLASQAHPGRSSIR